MPSELTRRQLLRVGGVVVVSPLLLSANNDLQEGTRSTRPMRPQDLRNGTMFGRYFLRGSILGLKDAQNARSGFISFGTDVSTVPTTSSTGTGVYMDYTGIYGISGDARTFSIKAGSPYITLGGGTDTGFAPNGDVLRVIQDYSTDDDHLSFTAVANVTAAPMNSAQAMEGYVTLNHASSTVDLAIAVIGNIEHLGAGAVSSSRASQFGIVVRNGCGAIAEAINVLSAGVTKISGTNGTITNHYQFYAVAPVNSPVITNKYSYYSESGAGDAVFADQVGIGGAPHSKLTIHSIPTSAAGLTTGDVWSNAGVLTIV